MFVSCICNFFSLFFTSTLIKYINIYMYILPLLSYVNHFFSFTLCVMAILLLVIICVSIVINCA
ncbi:uncharacterized protein BX663DRAFT_520843 [Cokeromyces recurvatus]|uniref:uncharacterized protein n=1 Tax=Cokeromyces recurvatus TaxID=90255 RepID=UPI00221F3162|nr:uncharacterized protein BX663DRAFT_520843 [Cokeromyces recurvatus]KAI7899648.1 hypothetical protein BX663DRAFT_520843 [Cokeromyces recurvatus]